MDRAALTSRIRTLTRQANLKPITDAALHAIIEAGIDDFTNRHPFLMAIDRGNSVVNQQDYAIAEDVMEIIEVYYMDAYGTYIITTPIDTDDTTVNVASTTGFPTSGTIKIGSEEISYTGVTATSFTGLGRAANDTTAASHVVGVGVIEAGESFTLLTPTTSRTLAEDNGSWLSSESGIPTSYYYYPGVLGFDLPTLKSGYHNIVVRSFIRPPALSSDTSMISGLLTSFQSAIVSYGASRICTILAQDDQTLNQAKAYWSDYQAINVMFTQRSHQAQRGRIAQVVPFAGGT